MPEPPPKAAPSLAGPFLVAAALALAGCIAPAPPARALAGAAAPVGADGPAGLLPALPGARGAVAAPLAPAALGPSRPAAPGLPRADAPPSGAGGRLGEFSGQATPFWAAPGPAFPPPRPNSYFTR